jgi:hypothetical protein
MGEQEEQFVDLDETLPEEGQPEPKETESLPGTVNPGEDEGDDQAELKEDDHGKR